MRTDDFSSCQYGALHDQVQSIGSHESHNDSVYFNFVGPFDSGVAGGVIRVGLRPNEGYSEASIVIPIVGEGTVFHYVRTPIDVSDVVVGSPVWSSGHLTIESVIPTREWRLRYGSDDARLIRDTRAFAGAPGATWRESPRQDVVFDLRWTADFPVHTLSEDGSLLPDQEGSELAYGKNHLEQFGKVSGALGIGGRSWEISQAPSFRDHSWGPRIWESAPNQDFVTVYLDDGRRIAAIANRVDGRESAHGVLFRPGETQPKRLDGYRICTRYDGGSDSENVGWTFEFDGSQIEVDGEVVGFLPLRVGKNPVRIAQTILKLSDVSPGMAKTDLTRPMRS